MKRLIAVAVLMLIAVPAFADYGYHYNKRGTGYFRDDSNDGNTYNNANTLGMNGRRSSGCGSSTQVDILGSNC